MAPPTTFSPAIVAGTPQARRAISALGRDYEPGYFDQINVNNTSSATLTVVVNGYTLYVGPGQVFPIDKDTYGPIYAYTIDASANVAVNAYQVFETPGTDERTEYQQVGEF